MAKLNDRLTRLEQRAHTKLPYPIGVPVSSPEQWQLLRADLQAYASVGHPEPQRDSAPGALADFTYTVKAELHAWARAQRQAYDKQFTI